MTSRKSKHRGTAAKGQVRKGSGSGAGYVLAETRDKRAWDSKASPAQKETETRLGPGGFGAAYIPREKRDSALEDEPDTGEAEERSRKAD
jgi:hypothetical protein